MFGLGKNRSAHDAEVAIGFRVEETATNMDVALSFDRATLRAMARGLYLTYRQIDGARTSGNKRQVLTDIAQFALAKRHEALRAGASSRLDPLWKAASLIESIASVEIPRLDGFDREAGADEIRAHVERLLSRHLTDKAKKDINALVVGEDGRATLG